MAKSSGRRLALVIATGSYQDPDLAGLRAPGNDASELADVLEDEAIGGFEVESLLDASAETLRRRIAAFCADIRPIDLALIYLSCHGVLDDRGRLYYAATDTDRRLLAATALPASWLNEQLEDCRSRRQVLVLDCCHGGAFAKGAKGEGELALGERFEGRGRIVLTGSRGTEYSFEHGRAVGEGASSVFTGALVEGLRSGDADRDRDGLVTVDELYDYAYEAVREKEARQTPTMWAYGAEGSLMLARSPRGEIIEPAPLPEDLTQLLESARPRVREGAVEELAELLNGSNAGRALTARRELERVAEEDVPSVAAIARGALAGGALAAPDRQIQSRDGPRAPIASPASDHENTSGEERGSIVRQVALTIVGVVAAGVIVAAIALLGGGESSSSSASLSSLPKEISVPGSPRGIAVGAGALWVSRHNASRVEKIGPAGPSQATAIEVGSDPDQIAVGEGSVWVAVHDGMGLARIDPETNEAEEPDGLGCECPVTALAIADGWLWASSNENGSITRFDLETGANPKTYYPGAGFEGAFAVGGGFVWAVGTEDPEPRVSWVIKIDPESRSRKRIRVRTHSYFEGVAYGQDTVWIADSYRERNVIAAFDPDTEKIRDEGDVEAGISGREIVVDGDSVLVWNQQTGVLTKMGADNLENSDSSSIRGFEKREGAAAEASALAAAAGNAWVTDPTANTVYNLLK